ncbi:Uncharacterised protein [Mycobacteroides abscessus subsp. massiliense]|nr:Uncharacterised protein [Mycobacteroides abscessus subsp. massiliense]
MHDADLAVSIGIHFRIQDNQNHHFVSLYSLGLFVQYLYQIILTVYL